MRLTKEAYLRFLFWKFKYHKIMFISRKGNSILMPSSELTYFTLKLQIKLETFSSSYFLSWICSRLGRKGKGTSIAGGLPNF